MMTRIILGGALGRIWGKEQRLDVTSARDALNMINANRPGFINWIRQHADVFSQYRITLEQKNGKIEHLSNETFLMDKSGEIDCMRFTPLLKGGGKQGMAIVGVVLIVVGCILYQYGGAALVKVGVGEATAAMVAETAGMAIVGAGASLAVNGVITALASPSKMEVDDSTNQYYFNGPVNTTDQGVPIPLVFGRCKVGSRVINSGIEIKQK